MRSRAGLEGLTVQQKTLGELAELVGGEVRGDPATVITGVTGVHEAAAGDITFAANARYARWLEDTRAAAAVVAPGIEVNNGLPTIVVDGPEDAIAKIGGCFAPAPVTYERGIHPTALVADDVTLGEDVSIGAHVVIEPGASIGSRTVIRPQVYVGHDVSIGSDCLIHPNVTLREHISIGERCIIHAGAVIGSDGFGYRTSADGRHEIEPQTGTVVIEDDVDVGACACIDRARFDKTWIKRGTKIDNLVQIGHNVVIGKDCLVVAMVGLCGSVHVGNNVVLAGKVAVNGHVVLGDNVVVGGNSGVTKDIPAGMRVSGYPAQAHDKELKLGARIRRIGEMFERVKKLEKKLRELEHTTNDDR